MNYWWKFVALFGLVSLSLLIFITPVEAFGRCRHRCQCQPVCSPCACAQPQHLGQVNEPLAVTYQCMYCDGTYWQVATDGQACTMMPSSMAGTPCFMVPEKTKAKPGAGKILHGHGLQWDPYLQQWYWYSDVHGKSYCDGTNLWLCPQINQAIAKGTCPNGEVYYDIYVDK